MERKSEAVKVENILGSLSTPFSDHVFPTSYPCHGVFDFCQGDDKSSLGFMELLGMQDLGTPMFDVLQVSSMVQSAAQNQILASKVESPPEVVNHQPPTPNSSSFSSASSEALNYEAPVKSVEENNEVQEQQQKIIKKELKPKKTNQKRQREPRFAFMTKSEVDHLEDGYRWRKYGQKAVKNSSFPRSYYRCTTASCNVKKRVERSVCDPSIVVTTYEGQHTHPSPAMARPSFTGAPPRSSLSAVALSEPFERRLSSLSQRHHYQPLFNGLSPLGFSHDHIETPNGSFLHERGFYNNYRGSALLKDQGLLQDLVSSHMPREK